MTDIAPVNYEDRLDEFLRGLDRDFIPEIEAATFVALMREDEPGLLDVWLQENAVRFTHRFIRERLHSDRNAARRGRKAREFASAGGAHDEGDDEALSHYATRCVVDEKNTQRLVADMTGADHLFIAGQYRTNAAPLLMLDAFHCAVAKKVGKRRTADVMSEDEYDRLYRSITRRDAA